MSNPRPRPAYTSPPINRDLYDRIAATAGDASSRTLVTEFLIPPRSGKAWHVPAGAILRLSTPEGPQVGDFNLWNMHNPRERLWASRTRQLEKSHVSVGNRLWSSLPFMRPMVTIIADSLADYGVDAVGGRCHDLLGTRCDPYVNKLITNDDFDLHCHSNLTRAVLPYGLTEFDVHDVLNVFQVTGLDEEGKYFMRASPATGDTYIEFFAEQPLLCALSTCPGGDLSNWGWGDDGAMEDVCRPIKVEVFEIPRHARNEVLRDWEESKCPDYKGLHGMKSPQSE
ncbi:hypothetical protein P152DRAFT_474471 [Eremomyces bilateralis CBS 781.70]|uniref:DUF1989 domain-containing protein n=1 Tax=Eremomyces bilateralis CBS 781.70 TaxID=1392243 RepID=A0A6G1G1R5_9PEZI|nr:uncharacterized protein P152DRAFT_474471 [Eremomyces bilateralis CBS 781.70]KAF1811749.1 hypothetical protein P152DRAFT_474471 [Eremomyces bilateralis CBS 781.70]